MRFSFFAILFIIFYNFSYGQAELKLLSQWSDPTLPPSTQYNNTYNEVWGFAVNDHEYAVIGSTMGTHILDVTDPNNIFLREFIAGASQGGHIVHRDYHDYNGLMYAVADESGATESTLQIIDISGLPDAISVVSDDSKLIERAHNIFIDEELGILYACAAKGGDSGYKAVKLYSLADGKNPDKIGQYGVIGGESFGHAHDIYVKNGKAFMNTGPDGLFVVDFSGDDPVLIERLTSLDYPEPGYNHSGYATEDMEYYYFADETWGSDLKTMKINNFQGSEIVSTFNAGNVSPFSIPHNQIVSGDYLYVSYYYDGIQVYDLKDPANPERVASYATSKIPVRDNYEGAWGVYPFLPSGNILVSDMQEGLFVFENIETTLMVNTTEKDFGKNIRVYPNPIENNFNIDCDTQIEKICFFDIQGRNITDNIIFNGQEASIINPLNPGIYFLQIWVSGQQVIKKVSIQ